MPAASKKYADKSHTHERVHTGGALSRRLTRSQKNRSAFHDRLWLAIQEGAAKRRSRNTGANKRNQRSKR